MTQKQNGYEYDQNGMFSVIINGTVIHVTNEINIWKYTEQYCALTYAIIIPWRSKGVRRYIYLNLKFYDYSSFYVFDVYSTINGSLCDKQITYMLYADNI